MLDFDFDKKNTEDNKSNYTVSANVLRKWITWWNIFINMICLREAILQLNKLLDYQW